MSKESTEMKHMMRSPKAMMNFRLRGKAPNAIKPSSPLITYLESIPPVKRVEPRVVRLSPKLGYQSCAQFTNLQMMLNYLKPSSWVVGVWPAESARLKAFNRRVTDEIFNEVQSK